MLRHQVQATAEATKRAEVRGRGRVGSARCRSRRKDKRRPKTVLGGHTCSRSIIAPVSATYEKCKAVFWQRYHGLQWREQAPGRRQRFHARGSEFACAAPAQGVASSSVAPPSLACEARPVIQSEHMWFYHDEVSHVWV